MLRLQFWDPMVTKNSFLGNSIYRKKAIDDFGLENIHWITVGDSRTDWGVNHKKVFSIQQKNGKNHLRMSFEGSHFLSIQTVIEWSIKNMPNLEGIVLGLTKSNMASFSNLKNEYKVSWPFISELNSNHFKYFKRNNWFKSFINQSAVLVYWGDISNFLKSPFNRFKLINKKNENYFASEILYNRNIPENFCKYRVGTVEECIKTAKSLKRKKNKSSLDKFILQKCDNNYIKKRYKNGLPNNDLSKEKINSMTSNFVKLVDIILAKNKKIILIQLPENRMYENVLVKPNSIRVLKSVIEKFSGHMNFFHYDISQEFQKTPNNMECEFYLGATHYNNKGKNLITNKLIELLKIH